jgi:ATP-dependent helicase/nuclease subunit A
VWRYRKVPISAAEALAPSPASLPTDPAPPWIHRDAAAEPAPIRLLSPAAAYDEATAHAPSGSRRMEREQALERGRLVHRLLQALPDIPQAERDEAARRYLARRARGFPVEERERMLAQIWRLLDDPRFSALFLPGSRAEVPIVGRLEGGRFAVSGQVDRLAVTEHCVLIADYKTNRSAPSRLAEVPNAYVTQLALYRAVLGRLYPGKRIRAALVWTDVPELMEISDTSLDAALAAITSP